MECGLYILNTGFVDGLFKPENLDFGWLLFLDLKGVTLEICNLLAGVQLFLEGSTCKFFR